MPRANSSQDSLEALHRLTMQFPDIPDTPTWLGQLEAMPLSHEGVDSARPSDESERRMVDPQAEVGSSERGVEFPLMTAAEPAPDTPTYVSPHSAGLSERERAAEDEVLPWSDESNDNTAVESTQHKRQLSADESLAAAGLPTPVSMMMPISSPPARTKMQRDQEKRAVAVASSRPRRLQSMSMSSVGSRTRPDVVHTAESMIMSSEYDLAEAGETASMAARIKSIGTAPRRWTPTPTSSVYNRDSIVADVEVAPVDKKAKRVSRKLTKRSSRISRRNTDKGIQSQGPAVDTSDRSVFED